jgi:hypothetical protein
MSVKTNKTNFFKLIILCSLLVTIGSIKAQKIGDIISIKDFQNQKYKLFFQKNYNFNSKKISIYIFEREGKRKLILCENISSLKRKIIAFNNDIIYPAYSDCSKDGFRKIVQKRLYFSIEQIFCTNRRGQYLQEYFTFKYDNKINNFLLDKYSFNLVNSLPADDSLPPKNYIEDKFPTETYTEKDFGKIEINNFNQKSIKNIREKYLGDK